MTVGQRISNGLEILSKALSAAYMHRRLYAYICAMWIAPALLFGAAFLFSLIFKVESPLMVALILVVAFVGAIVCSLWMLICHLAGNKFVLSLTRGRVISWQESFRLPWYGIINVIVMFIIIHAFNSMLVWIMGAFSAQFAVIMFNVITWPINLAIILFIIYFVIATGVEGINFVDAAVRAYRMGCAGWIETATWIIGMTFITLLLMIPYEAIQRIDALVKPGFGSLILFWILVSVLVAITLYVSAVWMALPPLSYKYLEDDKKLPL